MKLLIIATTKFELDGITNVIMNYYRAMDKSDMQIDFVIPNVTTEELRTEIEANGSRIYVMGNRMRNPLNYINKLSEIITANEYDIVHAHGNSCTLALEMLAAKRGGARVRIPHSHSSSCKFKVAHRLLRMPFNRYYTHPFACSESAGKWLFKDNPFTVIKNGIDADKFAFNESNRNDYRQELGLNDKKVIGHIGHFTYPKNHDYIIDIFTELDKVNSNYRLLLIGDGELRYGIEEKAYRAGLSDKVIFTGKRTDVPELFCAMDLFILPSKFEGLPLTSLEAQAGGLPCILSDVITKETALTDLVDYMSIERPSNEWAKRILDTNLINRIESSRIARKKLTNADFNITENAIYLKGLYLKALEGKKGETE